MSSILTCHMCTCHPLIILLSHLSCMFVFVQLRKALLGHKVLSILNSIPMLYTLKNSPHLSYHNLESIWVGQVCVRTAIANEGLGCKIQDGIKSHSSFVGCLPLAACEETLLGLSWKAIDNRWCRARMSQLLRCIRNLSCIGQLWWCYIGFTEIK